MAALSGVRVIELGHYIAAPYCGQILADHGAEVIKVEPLLGEPSRQAQPKVDRTSLYFASLNRHKRSLAMDLKSASGQALLSQLITQADVLITNYGPTVPEKLGFDYESVAELNPRLVMLQLSGFGTNGPMRTRHAFDGAIQAMSGLMHVTGESDGPPLKAGVYVADHMTGLQGALGVLLALQARHTTGAGQLVDISMLDSMLSLMAYEFARTSHRLGSPQRNGNRSANVFATTFKTKDGYIYIAPIADRMWYRLSNLIGRPDLAAPDSPCATQDGRLASYSDLEEVVTRWTSNRTNQEVVAELEAHEIPYGVVHELDDLLEHPQVVARDMLVDVGYGELQVPAPGVVAKLSDGSVREPPQAPRLGQDTVDILQMIGCSATEIDALIKEHVVSSWGEGDNDAGHDAPTPVGDRGEEPCSD